MTMRPLILLAVTLALAPAALAASIPADWRRDGVDDRVKAALTSQGWRLEDDGRALDPKTKVPAAQDVLLKAVLDLRQDARRAALETVNLMLSSGKPLDRDKLATLSSDLPPSLVAAITDPNSDMNRVKTMAGSELSGVAAYFDGGRTLADRRAAAQPVMAGTPGPRVELPYYSVSERMVGEKLRASAAAEIGRDPFGRTVLARLDRKLPPIVIEDQDGSVVAQYDFRRKAVVLDRAGVTASVVGTVAPSARPALSASLSTRAALLAYLDAHPEAVSAVVKENDVLIVHELTHAWQDRRDPIFQEMARGNLPQAQPLEYEEEAYTTKNLYIQSKLKHDPASVKIDEEFEDYRTMARGAGRWVQALKDNLNTESPSRALSLKSITAIQEARIARAKTKPVTTSEEQRSKALDLLAMSRAQRELAALETAHAERMTPINAGLDSSAAARSKLLGTFYLGRGLNAQGSVERSVLLDKAEEYAKSSGNVVLIEEVRKAKGKK
jgi:hypothetical protein